MNLVSIFSIIYFECLSRGTCFNFFIFFSDNDLIATILRERCDGNRNLLHACVSMCAPVSNKDHEAGLKFFYSYSYHLITILYL